MKVLLIDAFDSFVYVVKNCVDILGLDTTMVRIDRLSQTGQVNDGDRANQSSGANRVNQSNRENRTDSAGAASGFLFDALQGSPAGMLSKAPKNPSASGSDRKPDPSERDQPSDPLVNPLDYDAIILGPGPGHPGECGYLGILDQVMGRRPVFGICLGMQAIAEYCGANVVSANRRQHGKVSTIENDQKGCFSGLPRTFGATRYHSLIVDQSSVSRVDDLRVSARCLDDGYIMGIRHRGYPVEGVQFHPESVASQYGHEIISNFFAQYCG